MQVKHSNRSVSASFDDSNLVSSAGLVPAMKLAERWIDAKACMVNLNELSILSLYSAMAVYALAFIAFAIDLAKRSSAVGMATDALAASPALAGVGGSGGATTTLTRLTARIANDATTPYGRSASMRVSVSLTVLAWALHLVADALRGVAAGRVPWANMYEFAMTGTLLIVTVFLIVLTKADLRFLGTLVIGLILVLLGIAALRFYVEVAPLPPALQSAWLVIHVFVASLGTGFFALGFALSAIQLLQFRRESLLSDAKTIRLRFLATLPAAATIKNLAYRINILGFILWTFTLMAGSIWAEKAWGVIGVGTPRKSGPSSFGSSTPVTSTRGRPADGAVHGRRGWQSSVSPPSCSTSAS